MKFGIGTAQIKQKYGILKKKINTRDLKKAFKKFNRNVDEVSVVQTSKESFENKAVCHPAVINHKGKKFMF